MLRILGAVTMEYRRSEVIPKKLLGYPQKGFPGRLPERREAYFPEGFLLILMP